jgi:hypothetical protein
MSQARVAAGMDRLPWLPDEPAPRSMRGNRELAGWLIAATLLVAGASYWMGAQSWREPIAPIVADRTSTTVPLPQPRRAEPPQPQVVLQSPPQIREAPEPELPMPTPRVEKRTSRDPAPFAGVREEAVVQAPSPQAAPPVALPSPAPAAGAPLAAWPAWQSQGAYGRLVRIGAFGSRSQAKLGWRHMVRAYPAVAHLQAVVVESRNSRGRMFYRFQIGTTSQAHSEVLCQRMEKISLSCAVVGLPWKPKGVER